MNSSHSDLLDRLLGCPNCGAGQNDVERSIVKRHKAKNAIKGALFGGLAAGPFAPLGILVGAVAGANVGKGDLVCSCRKCGHSWEYPDDDYSMRSYV